MLESFSLYWIQIYLVPDICYLESPLLQYIHKLGENLDIKVAHLLGNKFTFGMLFYCPGSPLSKSNPSTITTTSWRDIILSFSCGFACNETGWTTGKNDEQGRENLQRRCTLALSPTDCTAVRAECKSHFSLHQYFSTPAICKTLDKVKSNHLL